MPNRPGPNPHFFSRDDDGSARVRVRFHPEEVSDFEEAAGKVPVMDWIHATLNEAAKKQVARRRLRRPKLRP